MVGVIVDLKGSYCSRGAAFEQSNVPDAVVRSRSPNVGR